MVSYVKSTYTEKVLMRGGGEDPSYSQGRRKEFFKGGGDSF